jgi:hypothetical protein
VKVAWGGSETLRQSTERSTHKTLLNVQPEYEDCAELARANNLPWRQMHQLALQTWYRQYGQATQPEY